jgi:hypothetical protein
MIKFIVRTACVLLLAGLVGGALYLAIGSGGLGGPDGRGGRPPRFGGPSVEGRGSPWDGRASEDSVFEGSEFEGREFDGRDDEGRRNAALGGPERRGHGGHSEASLGRGLGGMTVTTLQLGVLALVTVGAQKWRRRRGC